MFACRQVAKALEKGDYQKLNRWSQFWLHAHVKLCTMCGGYHHHVMTMQDTARAFNAHEETLPGSDDEGLKPETSERIREAMRSVDSSTS